MQSAKCTIAIAHPIGKFLYSGITKSLGSLLAISIYAFFNSNDCFFAEQISPIICTPRSCFKSFYTAGDQCRPRLP